MSARRVLVVDDSAFFRKRLVEILDDGQDLEVAGTASNGKEAVREVLRLRPDVVTMDVEMPVMDGIRAVREIMRQRPTPILMFSSLTREGAQATLEALEAGAVDFLPKRFDEIATDRETARNRLREKVLHIAGADALQRGTPRPSSARAEHRPSDADRPAPASSRLSATGRSARVRVVAIGCSTGGPVALQQVLGGLPADFPAPLLIVQHMPGSFTPAFARRLDQLSPLQVREAGGGEVLQPGHVYLAPGGRQMLVEARGADLVLRVASGDPALIYKPSVDVTFASLARTGIRGVLALVLTGMGQDGREGARLLKAQGARIWAQDEASSTIFGMPGAVVQAGLAEEVLPLSGIASRLRAVVA